MRTLTTDKQVHIYADINHIEELALKQFDSAMNMDFAIRGAIMPDIHSGYALPIGAVIATKDVIVPSWVGYDIGCGVSALKTKIQLNDVLSNINKIFDALYEHIPVGFAQHTDKQEWYDHDYYGRTEFADEVFESKGKYQIGTLGSGNHFIEIGVDTDSNVWIIAHSGSRNMGHQIASHYMKLACGANKDLEGHHGFHVDSIEGLNYGADMNFCIGYACFNRRKLIARTLQVIGADTQFEIRDYIDTCHNKAFKYDNTIIHRKGATDATEGRLRVIPGTMKSGCMIVRGKVKVDDNKSLWSCSHGAGRIMSRTKAKQNISLESFIDSMKGIKAKVEKSTLDEAPHAYKDIHEVMTSQEDLVEIVTQVMPIINIKG
jgi:tRNA-splicing ligase RtcB